MRLYRWIPTVLIVGFLNQALAAEDGLLGGGQSGNAFAAGYPVYMQLCSRAGTQTFGCGPVAPLIGLDTLSQSSMTSIMLGYGCADKSNGIYMCLSTSQWGTYVGGSSIVMATAYGVTGAISPLTAPIYTIYVFVL